VKAGQEAKGRVSRRIVAALLWGIPIFVAVLCVGGSGLWLLGIPGDETAAYARPWLIGLLSVIAYPALVGLIMVALALSRIFGVAARGRPFLIALWTALLSLILVQAAVWVWMLSVG
jgi:hypothetical protein